MCIDVHDECIPKASSAAHSLYLDVITSITNIYMRSIISLSRVGDLLQKSQGETLPGYKSTSRG